MVDEQELPPTFREYYEGKWTVKDLDPARRMLSAHRVSGARHRVFLAPQLCVTYPLSLATVRAAQCVPRLLWWLLGLLRAEELRAKLAPPGLPPALVPSARAMFEALTCKACEESFSYERMETMGDAVLKFSTSLYLFELHSTEHEGQLAARKDAIISNAILASLGERLGLPECVSCSPPAEAKQTCTQIMPVMNPELLDLLRQAAAHRTPFWVQLAVTCTPLAAASNVHSCCQGACC